MCGYFAKVSLIEPTAKGRGSTSSEAPPAFAASTAAPYVISPWVSVGPSSIARTRLPAIWCVSCSTSNGDAARTIAASGFAKRIDCEDGLYAFLGRGVDLVHDAGVGHAQVGLARVVAELVARPVRVDDHEMQVRVDEGDVVVAPVPDDHVGLLLGALEDGAVVDPCEDEVALGDVGLVLLALLDGRVGRVEVLVALEALDGLLRQVAVGHRVPENGHALARAAKDRGDVARRLALAGAGAHRTDGDDRLRASAARWSAGPSAGSRRRPPWRWSRCASRARGSRPSRRRRRRPPPRSG